MAIMQTTIIYSGQVQGVGFRYTASRLAQRYEITGYVRNLPDGDVELLVQGRAAEIDQFLAQLEEALGGYIHSRKRTDQAAGQLYHDFTIKH